MQSFQGVPSALQQFGGQQVGQQPGQQATMTNIRVQQIPQQSQPRRLTADSINRHRDAAIKLGPNNYWQVTQPGRPLKLTGALTYVTGPKSTYANRVGDQQFVYWPEYRVAGTVADIVQNFRASGAPEFANLTADQVLAGAINPLNPAHAQQLQGITAQTSHGTGTGSQRPRYTVEEWILIAQAIKASNRGATAAGGSAAGARGAGAGTGARGGARDPATNRANLVNTFEQLMQQAINLPEGQDLPRILNVTQFDANRFTRAPQKQPAGPRGSEIRPSIVVNGRRVRLPFSTQPTQQGGVANLEAFVRSVVGQSPQWSRYVPEILQNFQEQLGQRQSASAGIGQMGAAPFGQQQAAPFGQQQAAPFGQQAAPFGQQAAPFGQQAAPFGQQAAPFQGASQLGQGPAMGIMSQLQQGTASPGSPPGSPGSSAPSSPRSPRSGGSTGFVIPTYGQGATLPTQMPPVQLPNTLGATRSPLPTAGLPTVAPIQLPGQLSQFPQMQVPGQQ